MRFAKKRLSKGEGALRSYPLDPLPRIAPDSRPSNCRKQRTQTTKNTKEMPTVLHIEKGRLSGETGYGKHLDRSKKVVNADPDRTHLNFRVVMDETTGKLVANRMQYTKGLKERIDERIRDGYTHTNKSGQKREIRKDAVRYIDIIMSAGHDEMMAVVKANKLVEWAGKSFGWCAKEFGVANIVDFSVHLDETTPHIHAVVVPITEDGRLCAKEMMGNSVHFRKMQEGYWKEVTSKYGIERSELGSVAKHDDVKKYYARVNSSMADYITDPLKMNAQVLQAPIIDTPPIRHRENWAEEQNKTISKRFQEAIDEVLVKSQKDEETRTEGLRVELSKKQEEIARLKKLGNGKDRKIRELESQLKKEEKKIQEPERSRGQHL